MKYKYVVKPRVTVRGLPAEKTFNRPTTVEFEKEDVLTYLRFGNVYRQFTVDEQVKVTRDNIDKVHVSAEVYFGNGGKSEKFEDPLRTNNVGNVNIKEDAKVAPSIFSFGQPITTPEEPKKEEVVDDTIAAASILLEPEPEKVMRDTTPEEEEAHSKMIEEMSKPYNGETFDELVNAGIEESVTAEQEVANTEVNANSTSISREVLENMVENAESEDNSSYTPVLSTSDEQAEEDPEEPEEDINENPIEETDMSEIPPIKPANYNNNNNHNKKKHKR